MVQKYKTVLLTKYYRKHYTLRILRIFSCRMHSMRSCTLKHPISAYIIFYNLVNFLYVLSQLHSLKFFLLKLVIYVYLRRISQNFSTFCFVELTDFGK